MKPGSVFYCRNFEFDDGGKADKLFIVMTHARNSRFLIVRTTSQLKPWRQRNEGCQAAKGYYYFPGDKSWFDLATWVILDDPLLIEAKRLSDLCKSGAAEIKTTLELQVYAAIKNCLKRVEDISQEMLDMLK